MKCVIIAGGDFTATNQIRTILDQAERIICADSGAGHLRPLDIVPHILMGDFDSITPDDLAFFESQGSRVERFPARKDQTDSELCIDRALELHASEIILLGATGSRMDHTLANILLLEKIAAHDIPVRIIDATNEITLVTDRIELDGVPGEPVSIIPVTETAEGVSFQGLEYPLTEGRMKRASSLGISNRFAKTTARISVRSGKLLVSRSID